MSDPAVPSTAEDVPNTRPKYEVADVFRLYGDSYLAEHPLPPSHRKVIHDIAVCRTAELGGHLDHCDACDFERPAYNSCLNRHCPKCQTVAKARWLEARHADLLPVQYFHVVFTLPHELNTLAMANKELLYGLLFTSASQTLKQFASDARNGLGGVIGFTAILHTWDQLLKDHIHLHCVVSGGVLSQDGSRWIPARKNFLFHVKALSEVFRGKFLDELKNLHARGQIKLPGNLESLSSTKCFRQFVERQYGHHWIVYSKPPFEGPEKVLDYFARYTHRVAISNHRILNIQEGRVTFLYRDRRDGDKVKQCTIEAHEFIRRFLLHVIPHGFVRIRHFGFLANRVRASQLARIRQILGVSEPPPSQHEAAIEVILRLTGKDLSKCPKCKSGTMRIVAEIRRLRPTAMSILLRAP